MGGLLTQNNEKNVISCFYKKMNKAQKNYHVTKKE